MQTDFNKLRRYNLPNASAYCIGLKQESKVVVVIVLQSDLITEMLLGNLNWLFDLKFLL